MGKPSCVMTYIAYHQEGMVRDLFANPNKEAWYATSPTITTTKEAWYVTSPKVSLYNLGGMGIHLSVDHQIKQVLTDES